MILKFHKHKYVEKQNPEHPTLCIREHAGHEWVVYGEVSDATYGDYDDQLVSADDNPNDAFESKFDLVIYDQKGYPMFKVIRFKQNGAWKEVATQMRAYLCSNTGDTIDKIND